MIPIRPNVRHLDLIEHAMREDLNYDEQGKSQAEETRDSLVMLASVLVLAVLAAWLGIGVIVWWVLGGRP